MPRAASAKASTKRKGARKSPARKKTGGESARESGSLPHGLWSGTLSFGLVTIPVQLYARTRSTRRTLRMLSPEGTPLSRRYVNDQGKLLANDELARGYQLEAGDLVVVEQEELERLLPEQSRDINLQRFVPIASISPLHFERAYILFPREGGESAYRLLASTMQRLGKAGIATFVMRDRQYIIAITAQSGVLCAETLRFQDEVRDKESVGLTPIAPSSAALQEMRAALKDLKKKRMPAHELDDAYWERVEQLVAKKRAQGRDVIEVTGESAAEPSGAEVVDLMEVLRKSLAKSNAS